MIEPSVLVIYDLRDAAQWTAAAEERRVWGRGRSVIHVITTDVIVIEYKPGGALEGRGDEGASRRAPP